ncbi:MAG: hypothetical protein D0433_10090 [Candidatus Thermochlorobacter aerophilum]|jgi:hypothetical protein|uniref:Uncharacterized protein n=1 Tax=Candidatus Thermochlorobacter aerophilus TaxID=1868324 RepID=A0A395LYX5_9BACT|nr:MAG: hypothetical protein D0433_10090 [Candidatus Thermochlorobacter aerophilum]
MQESYFGMGEIWEKFWEFEMRWQQGNKKEAICGIASPYDHSLSLCYALCNVSGLNLVHVER